MINDEAIKEPPVLMARASMTNLKSPAALSRFFLTAIIGLTLDLWTKSVAFQNLVQQVIVGPDGSQTIPSRGPYRFIPGWLEFTAHTNDGAVFGIGQGRQWLFIVISVAAIVFLTYLFSTSGRQRLYQFILGMLLAGVLGNMYDRVRLGYVRDMIHALPAYHWPGTEFPLFPWIFNVADCLLCVGVGLMVVYSLFFARDIAEDTPADVAA
jgi:signal peptidase II